MTRTMIGVIVLTLLAVGAVTSLVWGQGQQKVTICHKAADGSRQTIIVAESSKNTHLSHGDTLGACPPSPAK